MAVDQELERHRQIWVGFSRLMRWAVGLAVVVLVGMALFLL